MSKEEAIKLWLNGAKRSKEMAEDSFSMGHFDWSLFFWQLTLEKVLKAILVKKGKDAVMIHDLLRLSERCGLKVAEEEKDQLRAITTFNTEARYENEKYAFYKIATKEYAVVWVKVCKMFFDKWLRKELV
jgi:HEPN domain-containing protein